MPVVVQSWKSIIDNTYLTGCSFLHTVIALKSNLAGAPNLFVTSHVRLKGIELINTRSHKRTVVYFIDSSL